MLTAAALVPDTALLVPGAGGRAGDLVAQLRDAALGAVAQVVGTRPQRVVVVAPAGAPRTFDGPVRASLGAAGVPDAQLGWSVPGPSGAPVPGVPAAVALHLLHQVRCPVDVQVVEVSASSPAARLHAQGAALVAGAPTAFVVVGSLSGRHGPDAPLADDPRAATVDTALLADLAAPTPAARARLAAFPAADAVALAVTGWAPWQVLLGTLDVEQAVEADLRASAEPAGAAHAVLVWRAPAAGVSA
ncbi:hypothetical protein ACTHAM_000044 [Cellulomonas soli]|uniref:hypothetical protein n=1 Tax=Cellulomonas soli TaxID=931535 RepID=UPI003F8798F9